MNDKHNKKKSHIQIPKFILKRFSNNQGVLFYLNTNDYKIKKGHAKSFNTKVGYFSDSVENYLDKHFEGRLATILNRLESNNYNVEKMVLSDDDQIIIKKYVVSCFARSDSMKELLQEPKYSQAYGFDKMSEQEQNDVAVNIGTRNKTRIFDGFQCTVILNKTKVAFVLPYSGFYGFAEKEIKKIIVPVSSSMAMILIRINMTDRNDKMYSTILIEDERVINEYNYQAFIGQKNGYLIADSIVLLESIIKNYDERKKE